MLIKEKAEDFLLENLVVLAQIKHQVHHKLTLLMLKASLSNFHLS